MHDRPLQRHDLVWLRPDTAEQAVAAASCAVVVPRAVTLLADWVAAGRPLIATTQPAALGVGRARLGLALPPQQGKFRLAFILPASAIARIERPPLLADVQDALPPMWRRAAEDLRAALPNEPCAPRVFGSAAMTAHTGLRCLGPESDLDLLFEPVDSGAARRLREALRAHAPAAGAPRIDGEVRNPVGCAVAWREWITSTGQVLVKRDRDTPALMARREFDAAFEHVEESLA